MQTLDRAGANPHSPTLRKDAVVSLPSPGPAAHAHRLLPSCQEDQDAADRRAAIYPSTLDNSIASIRNRLDAAHSCAEQYCLPEVGEYSDLHGNHVQFLRMMAGAVAAKPHPGRRWCPN